MEQQPNFEKKPVNRHYWVYLVILLVIVASVIAILAFRKTKDESAEAPESTTAEQKTNQGTKSTAAWKEGGTAVAGKFADADVVDIGDGKFRMYYSVEPEVPGNKLEVYSATSSDGKTWQKEEGTRKVMATFPDVMKLDDSRYRMYFQNAGVIKSATSTDGLNFTDEKDERVSKEETGYNLENVGAQTTTKLDDGTYLMVYRGMIKEPYKTTEKVPNNNTQIFFYATSSDGLNFVKKGLAIDSRNEILFGLVDGAEFTKWDNGELRLYFWSYKGVYHSVYKNGKFSEPVFDFTNSTDTNVKFAPNPPGDPTLAKINGTWYMYYGQHEKGIYYAALTEK
ncbi:MAG: hypothetical protein M1324_01460 [Patescibacteria group bacterium]|nr:hypothetical protein [Patescibacteria group bacterium]